METNKEFITRMALMLNELPEQKRRDVFTLLPFLDFQLKQRDNLVMEHFITNLAHNLMENVDWYGAKRIKKMVLNEIDAYCKTSKYTFKVSPEDEKLMQQKMGREANRDLIEKIKQETK